VGACGAVGEREGDLAVLGLVALLRLRVVSDGVVRGVGHKVKGERADIVEEGRR
jgi:hypothetical protein